MLPTRLVVLIALTDYFYVYQGTSVGFGAGQLLANDFEPAGQALTVVAVSEPSPVDGTLAGNPVDGYVFTPASTAALVGTDSAARGSRSPIPTVVSIRARSSSVSSPLTTPTSRR